MATLIENAAAVKAAAAEIDAAIVAKGGTTEGGLNNAAAAIAAIPSGGGGGIAKATRIEISFNGYFPKDGQGGLTFRRSDGTEFEVSFDTVDVGETNVVIAIPNDIISFKLFSGGYCYATVNDNIVDLDEWIDINDGDRVFICCDGRCILSGTPITLADCSQKPIEEICYDDELLTWNFDRGMLSSAKPCWIKKRQTSNYYFRNVLSDGTVLLTTGRSSTGWGHRMYDETRNSFVYTTQSVGDRIRTLAGIKTHVSCTRVEEVCDYFNVITAHDFNLFANGVLTSCSLNNGMYDIRAAKYVKDGVVQLRHSREEFDGIPDSLIDGLRLCEQRGNSEDLKRYVRRLMSNMKERN